MVSAPARPRRFNAVSRARLLVVLVGVLVVQLTFGAEVQLDRVHPDLMLLVAIAAGLVGGEERGALVGFFAGLTADLFLQLPFGLSALTFTLVGYACGMLRESLMQASGWLMVAAAIVASAGGEVLYAVTGAIVGQPHMLGDRLGPIVGVVAGVNALLVLLMTRILRWAMQTEGHARRRGSRW